MIDLHCHILHGLDDGPDTIEGSIQMARALAEHGFRTVAATPHMVPGTAWMPSVAEIKSRIAGLNQSIQDEGLELTIVSGMEIALDPQISDLLAAGHLLPLGDSPCLLIEPSFQQLPPGWQAVIFSILAKGYLVLLAHPERCMQLAADPRRIDQFIEAGVYVQVNWGSFLGKYGRNVKRTALLLARSGRIHCLATDSHPPLGHDVAEIRAAMSDLEKSIGPENLQRIVVDNPRNLLAGKALLPMLQCAQMAGKRKKRWWRFWQSALINDVRTNL